MSKRIEIEPDYDSIMLSARMAVAYYAKKSSIDGSLYEQIAATKFDDDQLKVWYEGAWNALKTYLSEYVAYSDTGKIVCMMPGNWNDSLKDVLMATCATLIANYVETQWLQLVGAEKYAEVVNKELTNMRGRISDIVSARKRPTRPERVDCEHRKGEEE